MLHGGMTAAIVDQISTMALMMSDPDNKDTPEIHPPGITVDMSIKYLSAAAVGHKLLINAETLKKGRSLAFLAVEIFNASKPGNPLVARADHTKYMSSAEHKPKL